MSSGCRIRPGALLAIAVGLAAGLTGSCAQGSDTPGPRANLLTPANGPRLFVERGEISPAAPVFSGGFRAAEVPEREAPSRWLGDEPGQINISLVGLEPRPRRLGLEMRAAADSSVTIRLEFDGEPLAVIVQGPSWSRHLLRAPG